MADQSTHPDHESATGAAKDDVLTVTRPDQLHAIGEPTRWRILGRLLDGPASIQELSRSLGMAKGTVGHHVRVLDRAGLIRLAEKHRVRGVVEKRYARVGRKLRLPDQESELASEHPDMATLPLRSALAEATLSSDPDDPTTAVVMRARMSADRARRFGQMLDALAAEFAEGAPGEGEVFGFVGAIYVPDWASGDPEPEA
jgi:DNA-binding transcriptional ArsR family regulator